jgi:hypothetical protein
VPDYRDKLSADLLQQFRGQGNTGVLIDAIAGQLDDLEQTFRDLEIMRTLAAAAGAQLDGIGEVVVLSRDEARRLASQHGLAVVMDDETYRDYLKYKIFVNTAQGTYADVYAGLKMFLPDVALRYSEQPEVPATMKFQTEPATPDKDVSRLFRAPVVKPAGVRLLLEAVTETRLPEKAVYVAGAVFRPLASLKLPQYQPSWGFGATASLAWRVDRIAETTLPPLAEP